MSPKHKEAEIKITQSGSGSQVLLSRIDYCEMQIFALHCLVANYLNDASRYVYLVEHYVFLVLGCAAQIPRP